MSELRVLEIDGLRYFSSTSVEVDGIFSYRNKENGNYFFNLKEDSYTMDSDREVDGYIDDTDEVVIWDSAQYVRGAASFYYGDIDEETWLKTGNIVGVGYHTNF